jgi:hypothetical protein
MVHALGGWSEAQEVIDAINGAGSGTVSSVALALPVSVFVVSGSPVTTTGTLTGSFATQTANTVFAGPSSGGVATPAFRSLVSADFSGLVVSSFNTRTGAVTLTSGDVTTALGDANIAYTDVINTFAVRQIIQSSTAATTLLVKNTASASPYVAEFHAKDDSPYIFAAFNDTLSSTTPAFAYFVWNTGTFSSGTPDAHEMRFFTNGFLSDRMIITSNGIVGIGVTVAAAGAGSTLDDTQLQVHQTRVHQAYVLSKHAINDDPYIMAAFNDTFSSTTPAFAYFVWNSGTFEQGTNANSDMTFYTNGFSNNRMVITKGGLVGIGTNIAALGGANTVDSTLQVRAFSTSTIGVIVQGRASQTAVLLQLKGESSVQTREQVDLDSAWVDSTDATRKSRFLLRVWDTAAREVLRGEASGTAPAIGFLGSAAAVQQASGANLTNNVVASGTTDQIDDFTNLVVYATDAQAIHNDIYQLARKVKQINDALRLYGLLT